MIFYWGCNLPSYVLVFNIFRGWVSSILWMIGKSLVVVVFLLMSSYREMISLPMSFSRGDDTICNDSRMLYESILTLANF
jgi:hypothetical protein